jgi:hypothetical protein
MNTRSRFTFLALLLAQAAHSIEEYAFHLFDVFTPARFVSSLVSDDLSTGFAVVNTALVLFGLWCYFIPVRLGRPSARNWMWFWILIEFGNGVGHPIIALTRGAYFPGVITAPVLLVLSIYLALQMMFFQHRNRKAL